MNLHFTILDADEARWTIDRSWNEWSSHRPRDTHHRFFRGLMESAWGRERMRSPALVADDGEPVATMWLFETPFQLDGRPIRAGGIGSVVVRDDLRKQGVGTRFMGAVHDLLRSEGYEAALLFSNIDPRFYLKLGYQVLPTRHYSGVIPAAVETVTGPWTIRPYADTDFDAVRDLHNAGAAARRLGLLRDDTYWAYDFLASDLYAELIAEEPGEPWEFLVGEQGGEVAAYLRSSPGEDDSLEVNEFAFKPGGEELVSSMLTWIRDRVFPAKPLTVEGLLPSRFGDLCPAASPEWKDQDKGVMMMRPIADGFELPTFELLDDYFVWSYDRF